MQGALFQSQHVSPVPLRRGHQKARLSLGWELEKQTGSAGLQRPMYSCTEFAEDMSICRVGHRGSWGRGGVLCVGTTVLEEEVWPWGRILRSVLKVHGSYIADLDFRAFRTPLPKPQTGLAKTPSSCSSNWKALLDRCQV